MESTKVLTVDAEFDSAVEHLLDVVGDIGDVEELHVA